MITLTAMFRLPWPPVSAKAASATPMVPGTRFIYLAFGCRAPDREMGHDVRLHQVLQPRGWALLNLRRRRFHSLEPGGGIRLVHRHVHRHKGLATRGSGGVRGDGQRGRTGIWMMWERPRTGVGACDGERRRSVLDKKKKADRSGTIAVIAHRSRGEGEC